MLTSDQHIELLVKAIVPNETDVRRRIAIKAALEELVKLGRLEMQIAMEIGCRDDWAAVEAIWKH